MGDAEFSSVCGFRSFSTDGEITFLFANKRLPGVSLYTRRLLHDHLLFSAKIPSHYFHNLSLIKYLCGKK